MVNELIFLAYTFSLAFAMVMIAVWYSQGLVAVIPLMAILANLLVTKKILLFGLEATASDALIVGTTLGILIHGEQHGVEVAQKTVYLSFMLSGLTVFLGILHCLYQPAPTDIMQPHFLALFIPEIRIVIASTVVWLLSHQFCLFFYGWLNTRYPTASSSLKQGTATAVSHFLDTTLFAFAALYKLSPAFDTVKTMIQVIFVALIIKSVSTVLLILGISWAKKFFSL